MPPTIKMANIKITGSGTPNTKPDPKSASDSPASPRGMGRPPEMISDRPRAIAIIANDITNGGNFRYAMKAPVKSPQAAPQRTTSTMLVITLQPEKVMK